MRLPRLYICFGMPKSGSTLAYEISRAVAQRAGFDHDPMLLGEDPRPPRVTARRPYRDTLSELLDLAEAEDRYMVVVKTHGRLTRPLIRAAETGRVRVQVHARDPRDIALSMRDAATRGAEWGRLGEAGLVRRPEDALEALQNMVLRHAQWAEIEGALCLDYEHTAFSPLATARLIATHMGVAPSPLRDTLAAKRRFTQLNRGRSQRHLTEMDAMQCNRWYEVFRDHIDTFCPPPTGPTWPSKLGTLLGRIRRKIS